MTLATSEQTVSLTVPSHPDYLALARLALGAVCRLTELEPEEVVDLKLAVTEAASGALLDEPDGGGEGEGENVAFAFQLEDDVLVIEIRGATRPAISLEERDLARAIIEATVDECHREGSAVRLVKRLAAPGDPDPA